MNGQNVTGAAWCWGRNDLGQVGDGNLTTPVLVPTPVVTATGPLTGVDEIANGIQHVCARLGTELWCWGDNGSGALGDAAAGAMRPFAARTTTATQPTPVPALAGCP